MDIIFIRELTVETIIGIFDWEREIKQPVLFDIEMACDCARAAATDAVDDTLNYKAVSKRVIAFVEETAGIRFKAWEVTLDNLDSVGRILRYVENSA